MASIPFADGTTFTVKTADGLVQLVVCDSEEIILHGYEFVPAEAHRIGNVLNAAAFMAGHGGE